MPFKKNAAVALTGAAALSLSIMSLIGLSPATAAEWLQNGGFESSSAVWNPQGETTGCPPRSGSGVIALEATDDGALISQNSTSPLPAGTYVFSGYGRLLSSAPVESAATLKPLNEAPSKTQELNLTTSYSGWSVTTEVDGTTGLRVGVYVTSAEPVVACFDDLSLEGPITAAPSPTPSATATATSTSTATVPANPTSASTSAASTSTAGPATATSVAATATAAVATSTSEPSLSFINGGFEETTTGWRTQGGQIDVVTNLKRSGSAAGRYSSATDGTKFVYQIVAIDPTQAYEFQGAIMTEGAVSEAFLRVAWYNSSDGSGTQVETVDSPASVGANSGSFVFLTTGPLLPPPNAGSARLRVVLSPSSSASATLYLDDFSWSSSAPATGTPTAAAATATAGPVATSVSEISGATAEPTESGHSPPSRGLVSEASSARATAASGQAPALAGAVTSTPRRTGPSQSSGELTQPYAAARDEPLWPYLAAVPVAGALAAAGYYYTKRRAI